MTYGPLASRITGPIHRQNDPHTYSAVARETQREPPRGPKALLNDSRGGGYGPRGRGFAGRGEARDRDFRDIRDAPISRTREWHRRSRVDGREGRPSTTNHNRSRSPPPQKIREPREFIPRETDSNRARRDSRDGPLSASSSVSEILPSTPFSNTGSFRGRGRGGGDWEYGKVGRGNYAEERDGFRNRSRSRDSGWERKPRDERDQRDQDFSRRDDDARKERDDRERDAERHKRELPGFQPDSRNSTGAPVTSATSVPTSAHPSHQANVDRTIQAAHGQGTEPSRRPSGPVVMSSVPSVSRDIDRNDSLTRGERGHQAPRTASPPPQAPQVPAFGSITVQTTPAGQGTTSAKQRFKDEPPQTAYSRSASIDISKEAPSGPKATVLVSTPTGPKAGQPGERPFLDVSGTTSSGSDVERDRHRFAQIPAATAGDLSDTDIRRENHSNVSHLPTQFHVAHDNPPSRIGSVYSEAQAVSRQKSFQSLQASGRKEPEEPTRHSSTGFNLHAAGPVKATFHEPASQSSQVKIPTGPRAERSSSTLRQPASPPIRAALSRPAISQRQPRPANLTWHRPGFPQYTPRGPSIMNTVPTKRDYDGEERKRVNQAEREPLKSMELSWQRDNISAKDPLDASPIGHSQAEVTNAKEETEMDETDNEMKEAGEIIEQQSPRFSPSEIRKSVESNELDVEDMELDDEEFAEDERKFEQKMQALRLKRPATPRHHPVLLSLLDECDALASAAEDLAKGATGEPQGDEPHVEPLPLGLPSPKLEDADKTSLKETPIISVPPTSARRQTPPIESLPFLVVGPPTPFSEFEDRQQDSFHYDVIHARIREMLGNQRERLESENDDIRVEFAQKYKEWRMNIEDYEDMKKSENPFTPAPDSPTPASLPMVPSAPIMEGRRSGKNVSELDLERVLKESALTHQEEQERRSRETRTPINLEKEAQIPQMLNRYEQEARTFNDTNHLIDLRLVLDAFGFIPKPDDFTAEEQEIFLDSYLLYPKKWGTIAGALQRRDYQDCVRHYYYTKGEAQYKEKEKVFSRIKKGRRGGRNPQGRPKSNALMPTYDGALDFDTPQVPVTDTGRPRRAAAPTFGDVADGELATPVVTPARRNAAGAKSEINGDSTCEKPSGRRGRTASVKEKGPKKLKAHLLAPGPSPQKIEPETARAKSKELKVEGEPQIEEIKTAHLLANIQAGVPTSRPGTTENWPPAHTPPITNIANHAPKQLPQVSQEPHQQQPTHRSMQPTTSSYWSVPEQTDFQNLVQHFGTDWHAIANHMKSKTHTMVSNWMSFLTRPPGLYLQWARANEVALLDQKLLFSPS